MFAEPVLEFEALRSLLGRYVSSELGRAELAAVEPVTDRAAIESALADAGEAIEYLRASSQHQPASRGAVIRIPFGDVGDPAPALARLRIEGATLETSEVFELARLLDLAAEARSILLGARERFPRLAGHASSIADLRDLAAELRGKILPDGTLADHASVALGRLRREVEKQEEFVTIRNDRFVVPVVTGRERRVEGVIHGASGSGHTLFVEPLETIELNNELVRLHEEELREVHRILREFTARLREHARAIAETARALATLELIFAKGHFGVDFRCTVPRLSPASARRLILLDARHPLLEDILRSQRKTVVPTTLSLDPHERTLLISGPNTGGKTVALKTAGLMTLMTHAGLPVPAADAEFPLFDQVLADIGDRQSLQESLSTFSAHIATLRKMMRDASADSLVLIDELGRATDPEEGGALGVEVLEVFRRAGAYTLASTHLATLKVYGASTDGVRNGSMGFDEATLEPTYVLRLGAPGKSAGLDIASRLGLDPALIEAARERMTTAGRDMARFLAVLQEKSDALDRELAEIADRRAAVELRERSVEQAGERKYGAKIRELEQRAAELAEQFEKQARETIEELSQKARAKIAKTRREYQEAVESLAPAPVVAASATPRLKLEEGARVRLKGVRQPATVRRIAGEVVEVDAGFLKMRVTRSDIEEVLPAAGAAAKSAVTYRQSADFDQSYREINVIGQRMEQACEQIDKLLDSAALAQVERIRIVHGHGMGILKRAVADLLKQNPHVAKYYAAGPEEGGSGATIVELKV
jgi:DNA mismatch repair protein MutS2